MWALSFLVSPSEGEVWSGGGLNPQLFFPPFCHFYSLLRVKNRSSLFTEYECDGCLALMVVSASRSCLCFDFLFAKISHVSVRGAEKLSLF